MTVCFRKKEKDRALFFSADFINEWLFFWHGNKYLNPRNISGLIINIYTQKVYFSSHVKEFLMAV